MAIDTTHATLLQTMTFARLEDMQSKFRQLGAVRRGIDMQGRELFKTAAGLVLRLAGPGRVDVLSNCAC